MKKKRSTTTKKLNDAYLDTLKRERQRAIGEQWASEMQWKKKPYNHRDSVPPIGAG